MSAQPVDLVALDFESSGRDPRRDRVVQAGVVAFRWREPPRAVPTAGVPACDRPRVPVSGLDVVASLTISVAGPAVPLGARRVHGIDGRHGMCPADALRLLVATLRELDAPVVTYNGWEFDLVLLACEWRRHVVPAAPPSAAIMAELAALPPLLDAYPLVRAEVPPPGQGSLVAACASRGVRLRRAHEAVADAEATGYLLGAILIERAWSLEDAVAAQASLRADWDRAFCR